MNKRMKSYSELITISDYNDRFKYLRLDGAVGNPTFGFNRYLNQILYRCKEWRDIRNQVIIRDEANDLGHPDYPILGKVLIHHMNPITEEDILERHSNVFDLENLISVSHKTHNAIHYGNEDVPGNSLVQRYLNDTSPWKK